MMNNIRPVATYARVSTDGQAVEGQQVELERFCAGRGWSIGYRVKDVMSGGRVDRAGLMELMALVRRGEVSRVVVVKIDRLARSLTHFVNLVREMDRHGVALVATSQGIDTARDNPAGRLQMNMLAVVAEFERTLISDRTKAGLVLAKAKGRKLGKPSEKLVANWREVIEQWRVETGGVGYGNLAKRLGGVNRSTAWRKVMEMGGPEAAWVGKEVQP